MEGFLARRTTGEAGLTSLAVGTALIVPAPAADRPARCGKVQSAAGCPMNPAALLLAAADALAARLGARVSGGASEDLARQRDTLARLVEAEGRAAAGRAAPARPAVRRRAPPPR